MHRLCCCGDEITLTKTVYKRDRIFWLVALQTGVFSIFMGGFGPALPLLQAAQGTSAAVAGLHGTALGLASIIAGYIAAPLAHRYGRYKSIWIGLAIFNIGALSFIIFPSPWQTIPSILIAGIGITTIINNAFLYIANHYGENAPRATAQANGISSTFFLMGNFLIGMIASTTFNWRLGLLVALPFTFLLYFFMGRHHSPEHIPDDQGKQSGSLPLRYWIGWIGLLFTISAEFSISFWSAALLRERTGLTAALSTTLVLAFPLGMAIGRLSGTSFAPRIGIDRRLQIVLFMQVFGFALFWYSGNPIFSFLSLLIAGLGTSIQFPLTTLRLLNFGKEKPDLAMGKSGFAAGIAIGGAPLLLGFLADQFGIVQAFLIVPIAITLAFSIVTLIPIREEAAL